MEKNLNLIYKRVQAGYTQLKLSKALRELGDMCTQNEISKYENNNKFKPRTNRAKNIANILGCRVEDIF